MRLVLMANDGPAITEEVRRATRLLPGSSFNGVTITKDAVILDHFDGVSSLVVGEKDTCTKIMEEFIEHEKCDLSRNYILYRFTDSYETSWRANYEDLMAKGILVPVRADVNLQ